MYSYSRAVLGAYTFVPKDEILNINITRNEHTFSSKFDSSVKAVTFTETENWLGFPRHAQRISSTFAKKIIDKRSLGHAINLTFRPEKELWDYQQKAIDEFSELVNKGGSGFFLEAAPGAGKTVMGIKMLSILQRSALIVVPKSDLVEQWSARLMEYTNVRRDQIGYAGDGKCDWEGKDIVIGLIHTVAMNRWGKDFRKYFGVVLFDECDSSIPPATFSPAVSMFSAKYRIGMTASATRTDGMHKVFEEHLCQHRLVCKKSKTMAPTVIMHYYHGSSGIIPEFIEAAMSRRGILISKLASNPERNKLIAAYAQKSYERARPTLVISDRKEQLKALWDLLVCTHNIPKSEIGYYVRTLDGKTIKKKDKERIANDCTIILGTYGIIRRGTDIQRLSTLILATPQSDLRQTQGRIERFLEGKQKPIVVDIVDSFYRECILSSRQRLKHYKYNGLTIKKRGLNEDRQ